eukprot:5239829-Prorocentrum_lima.AAC.1
MCTAIAAQIRAVHAKSTQRPTQRASFACSVHEAHLCLRWWAHRMAYQAPHHTVTSPTTTSQAYAHAILW